MSTLVWINHLYKSPLIKDSENMEEEGGKGREESHEMLNFGPGVIVSHFKSIAVVTCIRQSKQKSHPK